MSFAMMIAVGCAWAACGKTENTTVKTDSTGTTTTTTAPDNTAMNKRDQNTGTVTPVDQSEAAGDVKITADIRKAVMDDNSLSTNAHNVKIITGKGGVVTLRGVVNSAAEKDSVETKAKTVAGVASVDNQLEVKNP
jgi:osmotically-inducible protein OsmY